MRKTTRIQLEIPKKLVRQLDQLRKEMDLSTRKEAFTCALGLLFWVAKERKDQRLVVSVNDGTERELVMPPLERVTKRAKRDQQDGEPQAATATSRREIK